MNKSMGAAKEITNICNYLKIVKIPTDNNSIFIK